ncbi:hypothetical protein J2W35_002114 [Variovorax boronicumulans]|uniref:hypothetical protein n=1 Tax=Variovorax boronicumulans TaxID=436515 RepID=UPI00278A6A2A|nr:hypothetical protein [Variovorax boronicumulans]MDQ0081775.1 hypothetical protein [Variovorax boronicumulans]
MAASARASARVSSFPESSETTSVESLVLQACDDIDSFHAVHRAYACLEKLIVPQGVNDTEEVYPTRAELSALVRLVNEELQRRIEAAEVTIQSWRVVVGGDGAQ